MIYHVNRVSFKVGVNAEDKRHGLELLRRQGEIIPAVKSFVVGADLGGDFEVGAIFVLEDLEGFWEYLVHPVHFESEKWGFPFVEKFEPSTPPIPRTPNTARRSPPYTPAATRRTPSWQPWCRRCRRSLRRATRGRPSRSAR